MEGGITIVKERDQSYSTADLSKAKAHVFSSFYIAVSQNINAKFFCLFGNKSIMLVDSSMLQGLKDSGALQYCINQITWIER